MQTTWQQFVGSVNNCLRKAWFWLNGQGFMSCLRDSWNINVNLSYDYFWFTCPDLPISSVDVCMNIDKWGQEHQCPWWISLHKWTKAVVTWMKLCWCFQLDPKQLMKTCPAIAKNWPYSSSEPRGSTTHFIIHPHVAHAWYTILKGWNKLSVICLEDLVISQDKVWNWLKAQV